ncbi:P22 coat protein-gene protein 5 [Treponema bryantii]|uniref:p22 coat protein-gene protein 5 n=2 Tax=Treponema bryantii TaxID=163 RepID=A0A1H9AV58_9SPIR|nr:P22 coat protein-gene protein 5 [Treponema bryantii]
MIPATIISAKASSVKKGQMVEIPITPMGDNEDIREGVTPTADLDTIETVGVTIQKIRRGKPIVWTGEGEAGVSGSGMLDPIQVEQYAQRIRGLRNEMEADACEEAVISAVNEGSVLGTIGTNPFASNTSILTDALKNLEDVGAPLGELQAILNTTSGRNLRNIEHLQKVNEAGTGDLLRRGILGDLFGFTIRESAGMRHAKGTASGYLVNGGASEGATQVTMDTGEGTFKKGDLVKFGSDTTLYAVAEDVATGGTTLKLQTALKADVANDAAITVQNYAPNSVFSRGSIIMASRVPFVPSKGDNALDRAIITDPLTGIPYELAVWGAPYQTTVTIGTAWGFKNIKPENSIALLG